MENKSYRENAIISFPDSRAGFSSDYLTVVTTYAVCLNSNLKPYVDTSNTWFNPTFNFEKGHAEDLTINPWNWWFDQQPINPAVPTYNVGYDRSLLSHDPRTFMSQNSVLLYAAMADTYLKPKQYIQDKIEYLYQSQLQGKNVLGVVARGTENLHYHPEYPKVHANEWPDRIQQYLDQYPEIDTIFLGICDDNEILDAILTRFPETIYLEGMFRKTTQTVQDVLGDPKKMWWLTPLEGTVADHRKRLGEECLLATKLIAKCDYFLGACSGMSNLAQFFNKKEFKVSHII
jgi:hypothetical protein